MLGIVHVCDIDRAPCNTRSYSQAGMLPSAVTNVLSNPQHATQLTKTCMSIWTASLLTATLHNTAAAAAKTLQSQQAYSAAEGCPLLPMLLLQLRQSQQGTTGCVSVTQPSSCSCRHVVLPHPHPSAVPYQRRRGSPAESTQHHRPAQPHRTKTSNSKAAGVSCTHTLKSMVQRQCAPACLSQILMQA